jgi:hypothetical protein
MTSEANTTLVSEGCVSCPPPPEQAVRASETAECGCNAGYAGMGWRCVQGGRMGGSATVRARHCQGPGGECAPSSVPWNRAGTRKVKPLLVAVEVLAAWCEHWVGVAQMNSTTRVLPGACSSTLCRRSLGAHEGCLGRCACRRY